MPFLSVTFANFRNLQNAAIDLLSKEVYFIGENGQGKSNILESLYMAAYGASFRTRNDAEMIRSGENECGIRALFRDEGGRTHAIHLTLRDGKKKIEKNAKAIHDRKELVDTIPCVLFNHDDLDFVIGAPDRRRFFIDQSLSMYDSVYIDVLRAYKKILRSRNLVLKNADPAVLDALDAQLAEVGIDVVARRTKTIRSFNQVFTRLYREVCGIDGVVIDYSPSWKHDSPDSARVHLAERREYDIRMCTTMSGPHRDRIRFFRDGKPFVPTASMGQRRLLALLLRTAQAQFYTEITGRSPVLLMDDVLLELDPEKRQRFTAILPAYDQLFCTFLPGEPYERYRRSTTRVYHISEGEWRE